MRLIIILLITCLFMEANAQKKEYKINEQTIVKDTLGNIIPYAIWVPLVRNMDGRLMPINTQNPEEGFIFVRYTELEKEKALSKQLKIGIKESPFFKNGETFPNIKDRDIQNQKINFKDFRGKIVVLNYWFINCPPCQEEIPHLNKMVKEFAGDSSVVFVSFCLDDQGSVIDFLNKKPFLYRHLANARYIINMNRVTSFPTHVVLDKDGKVIFHTTGYAATTIPSIRKTIENALQSSTKSP